MQPARLVGIAAFLWTVIAAALLLPTVCVTPSVVCLEETCAGVPEECWPSDAMRPGIGISLLAGLVAAVVMIAFPHSIVGTIAAAVSAAGLALAGILWEGCARPGTFCGARWTWPPFLLALLVGLLAGAHAWARHR